MIQKDGEINFTLKVKAKLTESMPLDIKLDLNPKNKLLRIEESLSSRDELISIFKRIIVLLENIDTRTQEYSDILEINKEVRRKLGFSEAAIEGKYDDNFKPPFEKISKIIYCHHSPGEASVSYARSYNGDKPPSAF